MWLAQWLRDKRLESTDRVAHELQVLVETMRTAGFCDQINLGERSGPRDCGSNPQKPHWDTSKFSRESREQEMR